MTSRENDLFGVLDNKSLIRRFVLYYRWEFLLVVCILTRPTGSPKYGTTRKNTQRYYTTKRLIRYIYSRVVCVKNPNERGTSEWGLLTQTTSE